MTSYTMKERSHGGTRILFFYASLQAGSRPLANLLVFKIIFLEIQIQNHYTVGDQNIYLSWSRFWWKFSSFLIIETHTVYTINYTNVLLIYKFKSLQGEPGT